MDSKVLIVGAGCFGLSTALHLLKAGFTDITIIDRAQTLPAPDGSSNDFNRSSLLLLPCCLLLIVIYDLVVRTSYSDPFYSKFAREAIASWKADWGEYYHEWVIPKVLAPSD